MQVTIESDHFKAGAVASALKKASCRAAAAKSLPRSVVAALQAVAVESSLFGAAARDLKVQGIGEKALQQCCDRGLLLQEGASHASVYRLTDAGAGALRVR